MTLDIKFGDMNKDPPKIKQNMLLRVILTVTLKSTFVFFIKFSDVLFKKISYFVNIIFVLSIHSVQCTQLSSDHIT